MSRMIIPRLMLSFSRLRVSIKTKFLPPRMLKLSFRQSLDRLKSLPLKTRSSRLQSVKLKLSMRTLIESLRLKSKSSNNLKLPKKNISVA